MIYSIEYSKAADKTLKKWKKSNPRLFKKATAILMVFKQRNITTTNSIPSFEGTISCCCKA